MNADFEQSVMRYQLRLMPGEELGSISKRLCAAAASFLEKIPGWGRHGVGDIRALEMEVHDCLGFYVAGYDLCGIKISCFESAEALDPGAPADPVLVSPHDWEGIRVLVIEVRRGLDELWAALVAAVFRALCQDPRRAAEAKSARPALQRVLLSVLGPRLFRSREYQCDVCNVVKRIDPWRLRR